MLKQLMNPNFFDKFQNLKSIVFIEQERQQMDSFITSYTWDYQILHKPELVKYLSSTDVSPYLVFIGGVRVSNEGAVKAYF